MEMVSAAVKPTRQRVVLVPYYAQAHITQMLQLAYILHSKGFLITIAHTKYKSPNTSNHPDFSFLPLPDNLDGYDTSFSNTLNTISFMTANCKGPLEEYMIQMDGEVACIIYDCMMSFVDAVADRLKLPSIVLRTGPATSMHINTVMLQLMAEKVIPVQESHLLDTIPGMHPFKFKDLPLTATVQYPEEVLNFFRSLTDIRSSSAVIWNTIDALENWALQELQKQYKSVPIFSIGPFYKFSPKISSTSFIDEDDSCLLWLDKQAPNSVIYISLGSVATVDEKELLEMACGLAKSEQPFLLVVRPSLLGGGSTSDAIETLPEEFKKLNGEKGCIVKWAPQQKVLAHSSVGGFFTHCGWTSILESMYEGVPYICWPIFTDQMLVSRYLTDVWKIGLELESMNEICIEKAIRTLMASDEGKTMRDRAYQMKVELEQSINRGGSSYESVDRLVDFIISLSRYKQ